MMFDCQFDSPSDAERTSELGSRHMQSDVFKKCPRFRICSYRPACTGLFPAAVAWLKPAMACFVFCLAGQTNHYQ